MKHIQNTLRLIFSVALLTMVWLNAHWSVTLSLSFIYFQSELIVILIRKLYENT
jgi:hypothetical protein